MRAKEGSRARRPVERRGSLGSSELLYVHEGFDKRDELIVSNFPYMQLASFIDDTQETGRRILVLGVGVAVLCEDLKKRFGRNGAGGSWCSGAGSRTHVPAIEALCGWEIDASEAPVERENECRYYLEGAISERCSPERASQIIRKPPCRSRFNFRRMATCAVVGNDEFRQGCMGVGVLQPADMPLTCDKLRIKNRLFAAMAHSRAKNSFVNPITSPKRGVQHEVKKSTVPVLHQDRETIFGGGGVLEASAGLAKTEEETAGLGHGVQIDGVLGTALYSILVGNFGDAEFAAHEFNVVYCDRTFSMFTTSEKIRALNRLRRWLTQGAEMFLIDFVASEVHDETHFNQDTKYNLAKTACVDYHRKCGIHVCSMEEYLALLSANGYQTPTGTGFSAQWMTQTVLHVNDLQKKLLTSSNNLTQALIRRHLRDLDRLVGWVNEGVITPMLFRCTVEWA